MRHVTPWPRNEYKDDELADRALDLHVAMGVAFDAVEEGGYRVKITFELDETRRASDPVGLNG